MRKLTPKALWYARHGWPVIPIHAPDGGGCSCGRPECASPGKHPRIPSGLKGATTDDDKIRCWFDEAWPDANIAIRTGQRPEGAGVFAVDIDKSHGGEASLDELIQKHGPLPQTVEAVTGGGGRHLLFLCPGNGAKIGNKIGVRPGIDIRGDNGCIVVDPSIHASGREYRWRADRLPGKVQVAAPPAWLVDLITCGKAAAIMAPHKNLQMADTPMAPKGATIAAAPVVATGGDATEIEELLSAASRYVAAVPGVSEGQRNKTAFNLAGHVFAFEMAGTGTKLNEVQVLGLLSTWNDHNEPPLPPDELAAVVHSAMENGTPRLPHIVRAKPAGGGERKSQSDLLVDVAGEVELFHAPGVDGEGYATITVGHHRETWTIKGKRFRRFLAQRFWQELRKVPGSQAMQDALEVLAGRALHEGSEHLIAVRLAASDDAIYLDLANEDWEAVRITAKGWSIVTDAPVKFVRTRGMEALPRPVAGGSINELRPLVNIPDHNDWKLFVAWLVAALRPDKPFPILNMNGEQGSAKSTACRMARALIDPNKAALRRPPREERDLMIAASNAWIVAFDNLSAINPWMSDSLCALATGGGFATRELYTDSDEKVFDAMRPVIINGIEEVATRPDLLDRGISLVLPVITEESRKPESELWSSFEEARPRILGALLTAVAAGTANLPTVQLDRLPRMADFAMWVTAVEPALGWAPGEFMAAYASNRGSASAFALESSFVSAPIMKHMLYRTSWQGTVGTLLKALQSIVDDQTRAAKEWPSSPRKLAGDLRRLAPRLRKAGINITFGQHTNQGTPVTLEKVCGAPSTSSPASPAPPDAAQDGDDVTDEPDFFGKTSSEGASEPAQPGRPQGGDDVTGEPDHAGEASSEEAPEPDHEHDGDGGDVCPPGNSQS